MYTTSPIQSSNPSVDSIGPTEAAQFPLWKVPTCGALEFWNPGGFISWRYRVRGFQEPEVWKEGVPRIEKVKSSLIFPLKRSFMLSYIFLKYSWVFRVASTSHTLHRGILKKKLVFFFFFRKTSGATEKIASAPFFLGSLSGLSCWSLLPTFWPWSTSMSLGSWNLLSGSGQVYSENHLNGPKV